MSEISSQEEMLKAKFEGNENAEPLQEKEHKELDANCEEKIDPILIALKEAHEAEQAQIQKVKRVRISKWPKGKSPEDRTEDFVDKHGGKIGRRPSRHSGKRYEGRDPNFKYWVPIRERVENKVTQGKIEDALVEKMNENSGNPHEADWSPAEWETVFHALGEQDWVAVLQEVNEGIDREREQKYEAQSKTDGEKQTPLPWDPTELKEEQRRAKEERDFGRDRFK